MGIGIWTSEDELNTKSTAWLVVEMCDPWFDVTRDTDDGVGYYQHSCHYTSVQLAAKEIPTKLSDYLIWRKDNIPRNFTHTDNITLSDYRRALRFLRRSARLGENIQMSY